MPPAVLLPRGKTLSRLVRRVQPRGGAVSKPVMAPCGSFVEAEFGVAGIKSSYGGRLLFASFDSVPENE